MPLIHVGLPKAASTTLQQLVFSSLEGIDYHALERKGGTHGEDSTFADIRRMFMGRGALGSDIAGYRRWWEQTAQHSDRRKLISEERFATHLGLDLGVKPMLLREIFGPARILLVVRRPADLLVSTYFQEARHHRYGRSSIGSLASWVEGAMRHAEHHLSPARIVQFDAIAQAFVASFGRENVHVLPMEWIAQDSSAFAAALIEIIGAGEVDKIARALQTRTNVRPRTLRSALTDRGRTTRIVPAMIAAWRTRKPSRQVLERIDHFAAPHVRRLAEGWDLPLAELGYRG